MDGLMVASDGSCGTFGRNDGGSCSFGGVPSWGASRPPPSLPRSAAPAANDAPGEAAGADAAAGGGAAPAKYGALEGCAWASATAGEAGLGEPPE